MSSSFKVGKNGQCQIYWMRSDGGAGHLQDGKAMGSLFLGAEGLESAKKMRYRLDYIWEWEWSLSMAAWL